MLMYFLRGSLPWSGLDAKTQEEKYRKIREKKEQTPLDELCAGFPPAFKIYLQTARSLEFKERPDYVALRKLFADVRAEIGPQEDHGFQFLEGRELGTLEPLEQVELRQPDDQVSGAGLGGRRAGTGNQALVAAVFLFVKKESPPTPPPHRTALSPLLAAAYFGNVEELMDGLRDGEDLEAQDPSDGCRPLHAAVLTEQTEAASYLIRQRADLESRAFEGLTPLLLACRSDAGRLVRLLLHHSADVAARDALGRSAQDICAEHRSKSAVKALAGEEELAEPQEESVESPAKKEQGVDEVRQHESSAPAGKEPLSKAVLWEPWFGSAVDPVEAEGVDPQYEAWDQEIQTGNRPGSHQVC
ncbi:CKL6 [Symbiodinium sp. CCMP2592]|nr:CKL6 [Symbiodinium sp. CCMP2592]